jgi:hypothetical protein
MKKSKHKHGCQCGGCKKKKHPKGCNCKGCRTEEIYEEVFSSSFSFIRKLYQALRKGYWAFAIRLAIQNGQKNPNRLTDLIFFARHPELPKTYKIQRHQKPFIKEWLGIKNRLVLPLLRRTKH